MLLGGIDCRPDQVSSLPESCVLEFGIGIDYEVVVSNRSEEASSGSESYILSKGFTDSHLLDILGFQNFTILGTFVSTSKQFEVKSRNLVLFDPDDFTIRKSC